MAEAITSPYFREPAAAPSTGIPFFARRRATEEAKDERMVAEETEDALVQRYTLPGRGGMVTGPELLAMIPDRLRRLKDVVRNYIVAYGRGDESIRQGSHAWLKAREKMLTASNIGTVLRKNPYETPLALWRKLTHRRPSTFDGPAIKFGKWFEAEAAQRYLARHRVRGPLIELGCIPDEEFPWLGASPDRVTVDGVVIEIKCPLTRKIKRGQVPVHYWFQVQLQMRVLGLREAHYVEYRPRDFSPLGREEYECTRVPYDEDWLREGMPELRTFHGLVLEGRADPDMPEPSFGPHLVTKSTCGFESWPMPRIRFDESGRPELESRYALEAWECEDDEVPVP